MVLVLDTMFYFPGFFFLSYYLTILFEEFFAVFPRKGNISWNSSNQLDDMSEMVLVPRVVLPRVRLEQVVPRSHLKSHTCCGPDVRGRPVAGPQQHLQGPVLAGLDVLGEVVVLKKQTSLTQAACKPSAHVPLSITAAVIFELLLLQMI